VSKLHGLPNTRSYFGDVVKGKKVSPVFIDRFIRLLKVGERSAPDVYGCEKSENSFA
jgi:hypothetical protein